MEEKNKQEKILDSKKINVCIIPRIPLGIMYGGGEIQAEYTLKALNEIGLNAFWLDFSDKEFYKNTDIFHFFGADFQFYYWMNVIRENHPIVVSSIFFESSLLKKLLWKYGKFQRGTIPRKTLKVLQDATLILPNSEAEGVQLQKIFGIPKNKIRVVPNGINPDFLGKNPEKFRLRYLKDWPKDLPFVLCAARIEERKNLLLLAESCLKIRVPLVLIGRKAPWVNDKYYKKLMDLVEKNPKYLKYLGEFNREDLPNAFAAASVSALVSSLETPGLVSLEAGLNGCNLVVGKCAPVEEYFKNIAEIVNQDKESISAAIERTIKLPRNNFNQAEVISKKYTWKIVAEKTLEAYKEALDIYKKVG